MTKHDLAPSHPIRKLFDQLRGRGFALGNDDLLALHAALRAGFGLASRSALRDTCRALWAKSFADVQVLDALFEPLMRDEDWEVPDEPLTPEEPPLDGSPAPSTSPPQLAAAATTTPPPPEHTYEPAPPKPYDTRRFPEIRVDTARLSRRPFVMVPQHPFPYRDVAQTWRRLRKRVRFGAATELDVRGTIEARARTGLATPPVLVPRRRNAARVLLLVDRYGSMAPYEDFVESVCRAIVQTAQLAETACFYFHNVPEEGLVDDHPALLEKLSRGMFPEIEAVHASEVRTARGFLFRDADLVHAVPLADVLREHARGRSVVVLGDAGAARGRYDVRRVIDALGLAAALREAGCPTVWLNPVPRARWKQTSAGALAEHVDMFSLDRDGTHRAISALRGRTPRPR